MPLGKKLKKLRVILQYGRGWQGKLRMLKVFLKDGGLAKFRGPNHLLILPTQSPGAPLLHLRDTGPDCILFSEILADEDYLTVQSLPFQPACIYDIGANIGLGSFYLRTLFPNAQLIGFEPSPAERAITETNYRAWGNAKAFDCAVGSIDKAEMTFAIHEDRTGGQHLVKDGELGDWNALTVRVRRIDALVNEQSLPLPDFVKMDIEGGEVDALDGFGELLAVPRGFIIETHSATLHEGCLARLRNHGFSVIADFPRAENARILCMIRPD